MKLYQNKSGATKVLLCKNADLVCFVANQLGIKAKPEKTPNFTGVRTPLTGASFHKLLLYIGEQEPWSHREVQWLQKAIEKGVEVKSV